MADGEIFGFEKLEVWNKSAAFVTRIYELTSQFPKQEAFGLTTQLRRAAVSIVANIAEGNTRSTGKDKARFFEIAYGSLAEIVAMLRIATDIGFAQHDDVSLLRKEAVTIFKMLSGLKRAVLRSM